jgi:integrase
MPGRQAKTLSAADLNDLLVFASCTRHPLRNAVIVLLSAKAGLRAGEVANLTWDMVVDGNGQISGLLELADNAPRNAAAGQFQFIRTSLQLSERGARYRLHRIM